MRSATRARTVSARVTDLFAAARELLHVRTWSALARLTTLGVLLALPPAAEAADPPAPAAPDAATTQPASAWREDPTRSITPSGSPEWVDRLAMARRRVLEANAASDAANAAYAQALYSDMPAGPELEQLVARRTAAGRAYVDALDALPALIDAAREAGVSPAALKTYQESIPR